MVHGGAPYSLKVVASILPMRGGCFLKILVRLLYKKKSLRYFFLLFLVSPPLCRRGDAFKGHNACLPFSA